MWAHIKNDGQNKNVNRSELIMGGVKPIVLCHRVRAGEPSGAKQALWHIQV